MPNLFVDFAQQSRVGSGYCLLKRCLRHACNPRMASADQMQVSIFRSNAEDGEVGFVMKKQVHASMKKAEYDTAFAFTSTKVKTAQCRCHAGGNANGQVVCIHNLPLIYRFMREMMSGFIENFLVELCSCWDAGMEDFVTRFWASSVKAFE